MQIVIDIHEDLYKANINGLSADEVWDLKLAIKDGTPLPKGHGRLIDVDELYLDIQTDEEMRLGEHLKWVKDRFDTAPTIIEADKAGEGDENGSN